MDRIIENLWITDNKEIETKTGIEDYIVISVGNMDESVPRDNVVIPLYLKAGITNRIVFPVSYVITDLMWYLLVGGKKVIVHCADGVDRSPFIVAFFLTIYNQRTMEDAYKIVEKAHPNTVRHMEWLGEKK